MGVQADVVVLGIFFLLLFTSSGSLSTIQTQLYEQLDIPYLGELTLFLTYGSFMLWCLISPFVGKRINYKMLLILAASSEMISYLSCILLYYTDFASLSIVVLELFNILDGFSSGLMWVAQAAYIHYSCEANGVSAKKGFYFGLFFAIYSLSNITSGLITTFLLGLFSVELYFWILEGLSVLTLLFAILCVPNVQRKYPDAQVSDGSVLLIEGEAVPRDKHERLMPAIARVFKFYPRMLPLLSSIGLVGISIAFYSSSLHKILEMALPHDADRNYVSMRTGIMFLMLGVGEIIGGYLAGSLSDKIGIRKVGSIALAGYMMSVLMSLVAINYNETVVPVMFAAFFWGFQEAYIQNWITVVCSKVYKGALETFIINKQFHCLTLCLY